MNDEQLNRFELAAKAVALTGPGCGGHSGHNFRVGAILTRKSTILSAKYNSYKTHTRLSRWTPYPYLHAEQAAIFSAGWDDILNDKSGLKLYVARVHRDNTLALAKPCSVCQAIISCTPIKEVYYSTKNGNFLRLI